MSGSQEDWSRRVVRVVVGVVVAVLALVCLPTAVLGLPPGRHYEMVSPLFKGGYGVTYGTNASTAPRGITAVSPGGEAAVFSSVGAFAGAPADHLLSMYVAHRDPVFGWRSDPLVAPARLAPYGSSVNPEDFSSDLGESLFYGQLGPNVGAAELEDTEAAFLFHPTGALDPAYGFEPAGGILKVPEQTFLGYHGASADLSHVLFEAQGPKGGVALTPEAVGVSELPLYDLSTQGGAGRALRLVGVNNKASPRPIDPGCIVDLGAERFGSTFGLAGHGSAFYAIADEGQEIFFTTGVLGSTTSECAEHQQLFVRLGGVRTLEVARSLEAGTLGGCVGETNGAAGEVPCRGAFIRPVPEFVGASEDGTRVFFVTPAKLLGEDSDTGNDLYMARIECPAGRGGCAVSEREVTGLMRISHALNQGEAADVQGVLTMAPDGSRVYFVARGVLTGVNAEGGSPLAGADNLYVYEPDPDHPGQYKTVFIADLCSESRRSGGRDDPRCPANLDSQHGENTRVNDMGLWIGGRAEDQTADDGRFLVFSSYGQLTGDDTDNARDVYRYDAQTGTLVRVSVGENGYGANGNGNDEGGGEAGEAEIAEAQFAGGAADQARLGTRAVTEDGSRIVFISGQALSPDAVNGTVNAYEWHQGSVSLVSSGSDEKPVNDVVIAPSGGDVFFTTVAKLLPQDADEQPDVYDARLGAGFPQEAAQPLPCSAEACYGPLTNPAPLLIPGSVTQTPGENVKAPKKGKHKKKMKAKSGKPRKKGRPTTRRRGHAHAMRRRKSARRHGRVGGRRR